MWQWKKNYNKTFTAILIFALYTSAEGQFNKYKKNIV